MSFDPAKPRFFVALLPPAAIADYANGVIRELGDRFQTRTAKAPPHVTLQPPFVWPMAQVADLERCLGAFAGSQAAVPVCLSGFGAFAPRVLYINVLKTPALMALQAELSAELEQTLGIVDAKGKQRGFSPHMTVASRNLTPQVFKQAWPLLQARSPDPSLNPSPDPSPNPSLEHSLEEQFMGDRLTLLIHDGQQWQIQSEFRLS
ncbi:MAG TPA: 2'-5' RNA ligase family protein [Chroococcidiopsis sp.]